MEVAVASPVDPLEQVGEEGGDVMRIQARGITAAHDEEILGQRQLPLSEDRGGLREQFGGPARPLPRHVALAAHGEEQRVDARGVDRMHTRHAGENGGDHGACEFVHEPAEERVFLRGPADDGHRPDRPVTMPDMLDPHHGKVVPPRVVAQMVAERSFRLGGSGRDRALDDEVGVGVDRRPIAAADHRQPMTGQHARECQFGETLRQGHHGRDGQRRRAAHEDRHLQRFVPLERRGMMQADAAVQLIVEPDLAIGFVVVACELHAVHAEVRLHERPPRASVAGVFCVDGRQRDERPAVSWPACHLREARERNLMREHRPRPHATGQHREGVDRAPPVSPRSGQGLGGIDLEFHQPLHAVERVGEDPFDPPLRAVEIDEDREGRAPRVREQDGRASVAKQPPLNLGNLQVGIDRMRNLDEFPLAAEGGGTGLE